MDKTIRLKKLYHFTTSEAAAEIMEYGFPAGEAGEIWFALHPADVFDEGSGATVLLEIRILPDDIIPFEVKEEHAEDNRESPIHYALPPETANKCFRRIVPPAESHKLWTINRLPRDI